MRGIIWRDKLIKQTRCPLSQTVLQSLRGLCGWPSSTTELHRICGGETAERQLGSNRTWRAPGLSARGEMSGGERGRQNSILAMGFGNFLLSSNGRFRTSVLGNRAEAAEASMPGQRTRRETWGGFWQRHKLLQRCLHLSTQVREARAKIR